MARRLCEQTGVPSSKVTVLLVRWMQAGGSWVLVECYLLQMPDAQPTAIE
jgi:spore maturation protein SpmB